MKILHYTLGFPPIRHGGLIKYSLNLAEEQSKENEIIIMYPGRTNLLFKGTKIKSKKKLGKMYVYEIINPKPLSILMGIKEPIDFFKSESSKVYERFLETNRPEIVHIHTLMGLPKEFLEACKKYKIKCIFTTHDYFGLCPKVNLVNYKNEVCLNYENGRECCFCNFISPKTKKIEILNHAFILKLREKGFLNRWKKNLKNTLYKKMELKSENFNTNYFLYENLRNYYKDMIQLFDYIHFNSEISKKQYEKILGKLNGEVIYITHKDIKINEQVNLNLKSENITIGFLGNENPIKGIFYLLEEYSKLTEEEKLKIKIKVYGIENNTIVSDEKNVEFLGKYETSSLSNIMSNLDYVVIPSFWYETFNLVALEAKSYGIPVIISKTIGAKNIFEKNEKIEIEIKNGVLKNTFKILLKNKNKRIVKKIDENFLLSNHSKNIIDLYKKISKFMEE